MNGQVAQVTGVAPGRGLPGLAGAFGPEPTAAVRCDAVMQLHQTGHSCMGAAFSEGEGRQSGAELPVENGRLHFMRQMAMQIARPTR